MTSVINLVDIPSYPLQGTAYPQGEFITGIADIMIGKGKDGTMMRLFYPSTVGDIKTVPAANWTPWGMSKNHLIGGSRFFTAHFVPVYAAVANYMQKNVLIPSIWEAPISKDGSDFPLVVFSHGLASTRSANSSICCDIASYGFIVAVVEHRDGSAAATLTFSPEGEENWTLHESVPINKESYEERRDQNDIRAKECSRVLDIITQLNAGKNLTNEIPSNFDLQSLKGKIDLSSPIISGHSFGGATAILTLGVDKRFKSGIILDPWMFPLRDRVDQLGKNTTQPMLFILMAKFQTDKNIHFMNPFKNKNNLFYTLSKGTHYHLSDLPATISRRHAFVKMMALCHEPQCPVEVIFTICAVLMKKFIFKNLSVRPEYVEACDPFLAKYDSIFSEGTIGKLKMMKGWDY